MKKSLKDNDKNAWRIFSFRQATIVWNTYLEPGKVNAGLKRRRSLENRLEGLSVAEVHLMEDQPFLAFLITNSGNLCHSVQGNPAGVDQIVNYHDVVPLLEEGNNGVTTNITAPSSHEDMGALVGCGSRICHGGVSAGGGW